jgi:hypothetical protein
MDEAIFTAGMLCLTQIGETNDGHLPRTLQECRALPARFSLILDFHHEGARLIIMPDGQGVILANATLPVIRQMCDIIHEIAEYIAIEADPTLFDGTLTTTYHADGGDNPGDMRHQIALFVERVYRAWLEAVER